MCRPWIAALAVLLGCSDAKLGVCGQGELVTVGSARYCVYDADDVARSGGEVRCSGETPVRVVVGDGIVCAAREVPPDELPDAVCNELAGACDAVDAGPMEEDAGTMRDARTEDDARMTTEPDARVTVDARVDRDAGECGDVPDLDGDGQISIACGGTDCDDTRSDVSPRATELCDGIDQDCDEAVDDGATCGELEACVAGVCVGTDDWAIALWGEISDVAFDPTERVVVAGRVGSTDVFPPEAGDGIAFVATYETDATFAWARTLGTGDSRAVSVEVDATGRVVAAGFYQDTLASGHPGPDPHIPSTDTFVATWDGDGTPAWVAPHLGVEEWESCMGSLCTIVYPTGAAALDADGRPYTFVGTDGFTFAGERIAPATDAYQDAALLAFERDGSERWAASIASANRDLGGVVHVDGDVVVIAGRLTTRTTFDMGDTIDAPMLDSSFVATFDTDGAFRWALPVGAADARTFLQAVTTDADGNPCIAGVYSGAALRIGTYTLPWTPPEPGSAGGADAFVACFDRADARVRFARGWGGASHDAARTMVLDRSTGELVVGAEFQQSVAFDTFMATSTPDDDGDFCQVGYLVWLDPASGLVRRGEAMSPRSCATFTSIAVAPSGTIAGVGYMAGLLELGSASVDSGRISRQFIVRYTPH